MDAIYIGATKTGYVEFHEKEGHGRAFVRNYKTMPATIIVYDLDDWTFAYKFTGKRADAIELIKRNIESAYIQQRADFTPVFEVVKDRIYVSRGE